MEWRESSYSQETAFRLARSGALVRIVTSDDACEVCKAMASRAYIPSEVPRLPIRGCTRDSCRCRFVAVDPETKFTVPQLAQRGIQALKDGDADLAREILRKAVSLDETYEPGWLWLSSVVNTQERMACLEKVLELNPRHRRARAGLALLRQQRKTQKRSPVAATTDSAPEREPEERPETAPQPQVSAPGQEERTSTRRVAEPARGLERTTRETKPLARESVAEPMKADVAAKQQPGHVSTDLESGRAVEILPEENSAASTSLPPEVLEARQERKVIVEQWNDFMTLAVETDPQMLVMQGQAFLKTLSGINRHALDLLPPEAHLQELRLQWQSAQIMGEALADALDLHTSWRDESAEWQAMHQAVSQLAKMLLEQRRSLRAQIAAAREATTER